MTFTIVGSSGFVGGHLKEVLAADHTVFCPIRDEPIKRDMDYGTIIYCAGVKSNFTQRAKELIQAHLTNMMRWLSEASFEKFVYVSSARLYKDQEIGEEHLSKIGLGVDDLYNQSKLLGESMCQTLCDRALIIRPSNILGLEPESPSFIWQLLHQASLGHTIGLKEHADNTRDFISIEFFTNSLLSLIKQDAWGVYNVSSANPIANKQVCQFLEERFELPQTQYGEIRFTFPTISNKKLISKTGEVSQKPIDLINALLVKISNLTTVS